MLEAQDLTFARGGIAVLNGVSFTLSGGEALVLSGPNGSGKTTLLRGIAGLQPVLSGRLSVDADSVAYGGHADGVKSALSVAENLEFWAGIYGSGSISTALDAFEIGPLRHRPAHALSAGQRRRLGLARILVSNRPLWALDEPTVSLDAASVALFAKAVAEHLGQGGAAILATHIDLGLDARQLDITQFRATGKAPREDAL